MTEQLTSLPLLGKQIPLQNISRSNEYVLAWWEIYERDLADALQSHTPDGCEVVVDNVYLDSEGFWFATLSVEDFSWEDPLTGLFHNIDIRWVISIRQLSNGALGLVNPVDEHRLSFDIWASRSTALVFSRGVQMPIIGDCYKRCREYPTAELRANVEFLTGLTSSPNISKAQFKSAFRDLVYEVQYCN